MTNVTDAQEYGFSDAVKASGLLFCSGQIGVEADGAIPADPRRQFELAFKALERVLNAQGCKAADIVDLTSFHVDYPNHMDIFMEEKSRFLGRACPAWTAIGVARLGYPQSLVEIKAIASTRDREA